MNKILQDRILKIEGKLTPLEMSVMQTAEGILNIKLSNEFKSLNIVLRYDYFGCFSFYNWRPNVSYGVIQETLEYREKLNLPKDFLVLAEDGVVCVLMKTNDSPEKPAPVIWCPLEEIDNLCETNIIPKNIRVFDTFTDFYEYLLDEEERRQQENQRT